MEGIGGFRGRQQETCLTGKICGELLVARVVRTRKKSDAGEFLVQLSFSFGTIVKWFHADELIAEERLQRTDGTFVDASLLQGSGQRAILCLINFAALAQSPLLKSGTSVLPTGRDN